MSVLGRKKQARDSSIHLRSVTMSNGSTLSFKEGDVLLIVGPNNSGKSTFLRNISDCLRESDGPRRMLKALDFQLSTEAAKRRVRQFYNVDEQSANSWYILNNKGEYDFSVSFKGIEESRFSFRRATKAFAIDLNAETRLSLSNPTETLDIKFSRPGHPYHTFLLNRTVLRRFARVIKDAFALDFTITRIGNPLRGYVGTQFENEEDSLETDKNIPDLGEPIEWQGDGIRSYSGIAAEIVGSDHPITLLDEPEAFLHPPQAKKLGRLLIEELPHNRQAFIATHSSDFLQGVLSSRSQRVKVLRLDRAGKLRADLLDNTQLMSALSHPSIANTNLLDSLFFSQTVICEGDSDCSLFDWAVRELAGESLRSLDRFWFATGGKHQTAKIATLLSTFGVDFRVILDLDAIGDWDLLEKLSDLKGLNIRPHKKRLGAALAILQRPSIGSITAEIRASLPPTDPTDETGERQILKKIEKSMEKARRSHPLKQYGVAAFRNGHERKDVEALLSELRAAGITLLPKGEIESYVPHIGLHGPGWTSAVLDDAHSHNVELCALLDDIAIGLS